jgi:DNA-binding MarR family transcriptional regulator
MLDDRVGYYLKRAQHALRLAMDATLREIDLTTPQYAALSAVESAAGASSAALARQVFVTPQTMNEIVRSLVNNGLLARQAHPEHGRVIQLYLTAQGEGVLGQAHARVAAVEMRMLRGLTEHEQAQLAVWLQQCCEALEHTASGNAAAG